MLQQVLGYGALRLDDARKRLLPRVEHRIVAVPLVERDRAGVRVHYRLDRVADVVDLIGGADDRAARAVAVRAGLPQAQPLRVGVVVGGRVAVDHPVDLAADHDRVGVAVQGEERRDLGHPGQRVPDVHDLRIAVDGAGQQDAELAELDRVQHPVQRRADRDAAAAGIRRVRLAARAGVGVVQLELVAADDRVARLLLAEVHPGLPDIELARRRDVALGEVRVATARGRVRRSGDEPEAVGVDEMAVDPVVLARWRPGHVADAHDHVLGNRTPRHLVPVDGEHARKLVVPLDLLQLLERRRHHAGVELTHIGKRGRLGAQLGQRLGRHRRIRGHLHLVDPVRGAGVLDLAGEVRALLGELVGLDHELLHDRRVEPADDHGGEHQQAEPDGRKHRVPADRAGEEQRRADQRDHREHGLGRQHGVHIRVRGAGLHHTSLREIDAVAVDPVSDGLEQHEDADEHEQVNPGALGCALTTQLQPQPAVQVVHDGGRQDRQQHAREQEAEHHADERIVKDEE